MHASNDAVEPIRHDAGEMQVRSLTPRRTPEAAQDVARRLLANVERVVVGKHDQIAVVLSALISGGHVLLEDVPGTARPMLARSLALGIEGASFARVH